MRPDFPAISSDTGDTPRSISPTDVSQFIRLDQCQRYLRLRLHERVHGLGFMRDHGMVPQTMPESLTKSGADFEAAVEAEISAHLPVTHHSADQRLADGTRNDNAAVVSVAATLAAGSVHVLFQPRIQTALDGWQLRGDVDLVRLERTAGNHLKILVADMKSSTASRVEHRLQVAFYHQMLTGILAEAGVDHEAIDLAILYRGPGESADVLDQQSDAELFELQRATARELLGTSIGLLDQIQDVHAYIRSVHDLVLGPDSNARRVLDTEFDQIPFHLTSKCDGCIYNEYCMRWAADRDDLSLLPHITEGDKAALRRRGVATNTDLARLAMLEHHGNRIVDGEREEVTRLVPEPATANLVRSLATTWPVGSRLDELIHRAQRYRSFKGEDFDTLSYIPGAGYGSLPYSDEHQNPNLIRVYIDVQHDYLNDRLYLLGALVTGNERGKPNPARRRSLVRFSEAPPTTPETEGELLNDWVGETLKALVEVAALDADGAARAPIHLIFVNALAQRQLLDALGRHATTIFSATALYDFVTQIAAFNSPIATHLETQIREHKNYPMVCQSLQSVAAFLKFNWNAGEPYRDLFRTRLFDFWGKLDESTKGEPGTGEWYTSRARFSSQIPLEYAQAAWQDLTPVTPGNQDALAGYRQATPTLLRGFHARRLEAMEHIAGDFRGNRKTELTPFNLPDLAAFEEKADSFAHALDEFVTIERHVELAAWKNERLATPEQRVLRGQSLILRYVEEDQHPGVAERNRDNERRRHLEQQYRATYRADHPDAKRVTLAKEQKQECAWKQDDMVFRLRIDTGDVACDLDEALRLSTLKPDGRFIIYPRWVIDGRLPAVGQIPFNPTAKQTLYGMRADLLRFDIRRTDGRAVEAWAEVTLGQARGGSHGPRGFVFDTMEDNHRPLVANEIVTLEPDPNNWTGMWSSIISKGLIAGGENRLFHVLNSPEAEPLDIPRARIQGQERFLDGLDALHAAGAMEHDFEPSKREYIGEHAATPLLLVQGPPGTGKSYSTAFALLARIQGAMASGQTFRVLLSCKTHAATDLLLHNVAEAQERLNRYAQRYPAIFDGCFDRRLLDIPLLRYRPRGSVHPGISPIPRDRDREAGGNDPKAIARIEREPWCVVASTPGSIYGMVKDQWPKELFGHGFANCLVLDEASQMNIPEALMAALPLAKDGTLIVVGDHRQMPPIVRNDWSNEPRRTFSEFRSYESLFVTLLPLASGVIRFEESFRLHADMAEFLRREIYAKDGINYHSNRYNVIDNLLHGDSFIAAVLDPVHPLTVVIHGEEHSQVVNPYEQQLMAPILAVLADPGGLNLEADNGLGVVVPHRAQRAALQEGIRVLNVYDSFGQQIDSAVDTVERFQGGERDVILIGATESDREYLLVSGKFLLDPRRLTVALSRARKKLILVASRSVFELFSADEETFANAQLWKNLLRTTCTEKLWDGERHGVGVEVWGNPSGSGPTALE